MGSHPTFGGANLVTLDLLAAQPAMQFPDLVSRFLQTAARVSYPASETPRAEARADRPVWLPPHSARRAVLQSSWQTLWRFRSSRTTKACESAAGSG